MAAQEIEHTKQKASIVEPSRDSFLNVYGRSIVLLCDEYDEELLHNDKDAFSITLLMLLHNPVSLILAHASLLEKAQTIPDFQADVLQSWDLHKYKNVLLFVPKIWHMKAGAIDQLLNIDLTNFITVENPLKLPEPKLSTNTQFASHTLSDAFKALVHTEDTNTQHIMSNSWIIYVGGHGGRGEDYFLCCGMSSYYFKDLVLYISNHVHTKLLLYDSCHAGCKKILHDLSQDKGKPLLLEFPIACLAFGGNVTWGICHKEEQNNVWRWKSNWHFVLQDLRNIEITKPNRNIIGRALNLILYDDITSIPHIRWTHASEFEILSQVKPETIFSARSTTRIFSKHDELVYLLDIPCIPQEIILDPQGSTKKITIESALPGTQNHYIKKLTTPCMDEFKDFLHHFSAMSNPDRNCTEPKIYLIDTVAYANSHKAAHSIMIFNRFYFGPPDPITSQALENEMYFEINDKSYVADMFFVPTDKKRNQDKAADNTKQVILEKAFTPEIYVKEISYSEAQWYKKTYAIIKQQILSDENHKQSDDVSLPISWDHPSKKIGFLSKLSSVIILGLEYLALKKLLSH